MHLSLVDTLPSGMGYSAVHEFNVNEATIYRVGKSRSTVVQIII